MKTHTQTFRLCHRAYLNTLLLTLQFLVLLLATPLARTQTFTVRHAFHARGDGAFPYARLLRDSAGNLYGTTENGGAFNMGTVFKIDPEGKVIILHSFWGADGLEPWAGLIRDDAGNLYGTTYYGGTSEGGGCLFGCGTVFKLDTAGKLTVLYAFTGEADGGAPVAGLVMDGNGNLYGVNTTGGDLSCYFNYEYGCGVVFKVGGDGKYTVLHAFSGEPDGAGPSGALIRDTAGNLYGTTTQGGVMTMEQCSSSMSRA
jgi:uncharacterized repeat protein (TIGR03803 family)